MDAAQALAELAELSSQLDRAVVLDGAGKVLATTPGHEAAADSLSEAALALVAAAGDLRSQPAEVARAEVELAEGGLFVLRDKGLTIAATTGPSPTAGLVAYDLRTCLHAIDEKPKRRRSTKKTEAAEEAE